MPVSTSQMIAVLNIGMGNILSLRNALARIGLDARDARDDSGLAGAAAIILPGVGAFGTAMKNLDATGLSDALREVSATGTTPILGICLGMQLLSDECEEHGLFSGLGLIPGRVVRLNETETGNKVPNVGWCETVSSGQSSLFDENGSTRSFYYVHSYHFVPSDKNSVAATTLLGQTHIVSAVERGNVSGVQFHPEKSQDDGLDLIAHWAKRHGLLPELDRGPAIT